jgi:hypothetical protein
MLWLMGSRSTSQARKADGIRHFLAGNRSLDFRKNREAIRLASFGRAFAILNLGGPDAQAGFASQSVPY